MKEIYAYNRYIKLNLIYRASRDGDNAKDFHFKCDFIGPNLTVIKTKKEYIFGGFTIKTWKHLFKDINSEDPECGTELKDEQAFGFSVNKNKIYENDDVILICLFLRRWRRKFKLFFIMPEFLDIIVYLYYNHTEQKNIALIIENIFFDLSKNQINYYNTGNKILIYYINEWYNNSENKDSINNAISITNEYLLKNDFLALVKSD